MALKASEQEAKTSSSRSKPGAVSMDEPANYLYRQQKAMEDWARPGFLHDKDAVASSASSQTKTETTRPRTQRENSMNSIDSDGRRRANCWNGGPRKQKLLFRRDKPISSLTADVVGDCKHPSRIPWCFVPNARLFHRLKKSTYNELEYKLNHRMSVSTVPVNM